MLISLFFILRHIINKSHHQRSDCNPAFPFFQASDFNLKDEGFSFVSDGMTLYGSRYSKEDVPCKGLVIFFHGIGAGRTAYLREINFFCEHGYLVYAFDNYGSGESQGRYIKGLGHVNIDIEAFFKFLDQDPKTQGLKRYVVGHSWGGYATLVSLKNEHHIEKAVCFSGFVKLSMEYSSYIKQGVAKIFSFVIPWVLYSQLGRWGNYSAEEALRTTKTKLFYIQGDKDTMVPPSVGYDYINKLFPNKENIKTMLVKGKNHQPWRSFAAEKYYLQCMSKHMGNPYKNIDETMDIYKATEFDEKVMASVIDFLNE